MDPGPSAPAVHSAGSSGRTQPWSLSPQPRPTPTATPGLHGPAAPNADAGWNAPERSAEQLHVPPSPPSPSHAAAAAYPSSVRRRGAPPAPPPPSSSPAQLAAWLARINCATNWYELRAAVVTGGGGVSAGATAASADAVVAVLRRLAAVARYDMRPPEAADLGSFLERWLLQHTGALSQMGPGELATALHSLAKLPRALPPPPPAWAAAWFAAAQPFLLRAAFRPRDLSLSLWALSRLQLRLPPAALQLLLAAAEPHLGRFNSQDLSLVALALAALQPAPRGAALAPSGGAVGTLDGAASGTTVDGARLLPSASWQRAFLTRCREMLPEAGSQALSNLLHGIVRSGMAAPDWLLAELTAALYGQLADCTPQALANVLSALAARRYAPAAGWVERFWEVSAARMEPGGGGAGGGGVAAAAGGRACNAEDLGHLAAAAAALELAPPRWWTARLYGAMEARMPTAPPRQLVQMLHAAAQLCRSTAAAAVAAEAGAVTRGHQREGPHAAAGSEQTWDGGTVGREDNGLRNHVSGATEPHVARPPRSLLTAWHRAAAAALPRLNTLDAAHSLWALAALGERPPLPWLRALLVSVRPQMAAAPPAELSVLLWSLAALRFRPTWSWIADCLDASTPGLTQMAGQDFAMIASALVRLGSRPSGPWVAGLLSALRRQLHVMGLRPLAQTAWALYRLRLQPPADWLEALAAELRRRWAAASASAGPAGGGGGRQAARDAVLLLWASQ
ncbi:hypothetical protein GPECTOR_1g404 [Gonium pectorale]|uniref:Uncharacterized protein n=1 Tax=Gonium pectorale TaxID=33097 RepID=A0A150H387_GONPE|nr:hypothetical protein GPECTOR_1g404 [Gonium pectorale]|eukprot:KXZ56452.1 hypothetical protein GPECTOR_1g404 [Gonium pectorale]